MAFSWPLEPPGISPCDRFTRDHLFSKQNRHLLRTNFVSRLLRQIERWTAGGVADLVLTPNLAFKELFASRNCPADKIEIIMNTPDMELFRAGKAFLSDRDVQLGVGRKPFHPHGEGERVGLGTRIVVLPPP
jgi:hypothetical protein